MRELVPVFAWMCVPGLIAIPLFGYSRTYMFVASQYTTELGNSAKCLLDTHEKLHIGGEKYKDEDSWDGMIVNLLTQSKQ